MKCLTLIDKAFILKRTTPFGDLDLSLLLTIADKLGQVHLHSKDPVFVPGEEANRMYFIVKGEIELESADLSFVTILKSGDFFGEESLFNNRPRGYAALALTEAHLLMLSRTNLYSIMSECPSVAIGFLHVYTAALPLRPFQSEESEK